MSSTRGWVALAAVVLFGSPAPAADGDKITAAIRKGADYLKKNAMPKAGAVDLDGYFPAETAVLGWALLEAGEKPDDPVLQGVAKYVRENALVAKKTYVIVTAIVFLDRLGDPRDVPLIQVLGVRLYAGLNVAGGWTYAACEDIPPAEGGRLAGVLYQGAATKPPKVHAEAARQLAAVRTAIATRGRRGVGDDNSNTQFGLIGLWVASRNGLPVDDAFPLIETRFFRTQNRSDAGWGYTLNAGEKSTTAMTCAGLLGLTAGAAKRAAPKPTDPKTDPADDAFFNPKKPDGDKPAAPNGTREGAIKAALQSLGGVLNSTKPGALENIVSHGNQFYVLWSIERVGVALNLDTIGDIDWYTWGADTLLPAQTENGSWKQERYSAQVNTSLALLFLCKANVFRDVSGKVKVKDPGIKELRGGSNPVFVAPKQDPPPPPTVRPGTEPVVTVPGGGLTLPPVADHPDADKLATALVSAGDADWATVLAGERDAKGVQHTAAIVRAIGKVDGARKKEARDALAERLTRMTAATLRRLLADPDPEVRRAASLACAMKDEKSHVPDLIDRITDPSDAVVRAARAGLKSLTGKDYGPDPGASDEKKVEAASDWRAWFESQPAGK